MRLPPVWGKPLLHSFDMYFADEATSPISAQASKKYCRIATG